MEGRLRAVVAVDVGVQGIEPLLIFAQLYGCGGGGGLAADAELRDQGLDAGHALVDLQWDIKILTDVWPSFRDGF